MEYIGIIIVSAVLVEAVVTAVKPIWHEEKRELSLSALLSLGIGVVISLAAGLDIAGAVGVTITWPIVPQVITGIIISRGANFLYDLISKLNKDTII